MHLLSPIIATKKEIELQSISPGIHAGVRSERAASAERKGAFQSAPGRGRIKPRTVSASARLRLLAAPVARPQEFALVYPGVNAGAIRMELSSCYGRPCGYQFDARKHT